MKMSIVLLAAFALAGICGCGLLRTKAPQPATMKDFPALAAALEQKQPAVSVQGKVVLVFFWTRADLYCTTQTMPHMKVLYGFYKEQGLEIIGVNTDDGANHKLLDDYVTASHINFPIAYDDGKMVKEFGVKKYPAIFIFDRNGTLEGSNFNPRDMKGLDKRIGELIGMQGK
jgi:peroxiredoxin